MRTMSMRLMAAIVATSLGVAGIVPPALAQQPPLPSEQTPLEQSEQPMAPLEPPVAKAPPVMPSPEPTMAQAQQPPVVPPPAPATPPPPMPPTAQPAQPDLFQETLKAQQRSASRKQGVYEAGAVVTNIFLVPGRAITCALGAGVGVAVLALTFGTGYKTAAAAFDEGCGGKWVVTGDDLKPDGGDRAFDWER
jgi:hypothetical protein